MEPLPWRSLGALTLPSMEGPQLLQGQEVPDVAQLPRRHRSVSEHDAILLARTSAGDEVAFRTLAGRHGGRVIAIARRLLGDAHEAEDVAQEALVRLWQRSGELHVPDGGLGAWLYRVAANLSLDRLRRRRDGDPSALEQLTVPAGQQREMAETELARRVNHALEEIPERQRLALVLFHYEGMSMKETAEVMETTPDAIESLLGRGRRQLKAQLSDEWRQLLPEIGT